MIHKLHILIGFGLLFLLSLSSCEPKWDFGTANYESKIVVEGWIENGSFPHVCLSQSRTLDQLIGNTNLANIAIQWAKVTVSDGTTTEVLTGRVDNNYLPPFVYSGVKIRGEVGKMYTLTVEYSGKTVTATTHIPTPIPLKRIEVSKCDNSDTLFQIKGYFEDNQQEKNYYKIFTRTLPADKRYFAPFLGTFNDNVLTSSAGESSVAIYRGVHFITEQDYTPFFKEEENVMAKFTQLPEDGFLFWSDYEDEVTNKKNPLFPNVSNLRGNIQGGLGIWCGYGTSIYTVNIKEALKNE